jgi:hypothetical protein
VLVSVRSCSLMLAAVFSASLITQVAIAQPPAPQPPAPQPAADKKVWKTDEYPMYESASKETQPGKRLELLDAWKQKFPASDYEDVRQQAYLQTYSQALTAAYSTQDAQQLALAVKYANAVTSNLDGLFAYKPADVSDADWATAKKQVQSMAQNIPGYVDLQQKDYPKAEGEFTKSLQQDPNQGQVSFWLFMAAVQTVPPKIPLAYFSLARSAMYEGEGALDATNRQKNKVDFENRYVKYHGAKDLMEEVENLAKTAALPPPDFKLLSKQEVAIAAAAAQEAKDEEIRKSNPMLALWVRIKTELTSADGATYFEKSMKGAGLPAGVGGVAEFKGKLIEAKPAIRPKELILSVEDGKTKDVTLKLDVPLVGKMEPGAEIGFQGTATAYTASPYMVTFDVEKAKITGWKGGPAGPARPPVRHPVHH